MTEFMRLRPPTFDSTDDDPLAADDWLRNINKKLELVTTDDRQKVMLASHQLVGSAGEWWDNYREAVEDPNSIKWDQFQEAFRDYHIPEGIIEMKANEFRALKQGAMTVNEYIKKFMKLARYAPDDVNTDKKKQDRFRKGLLGALQTQLVTHIYPGFNTLMNRAILLEDARSDLDIERKRKQQYQEVKQQERSQKSKYGLTQKSQYYPVMKYSTPDNDQQQSPETDCNPQMAVEQKSNPNMGQTSNFVKACFYCKDPGHLIANCPHYNKLTQATTVSGEKSVVSSIRSANTQVTGQQKKTQSFGRSQLNHISTTRI
jgi:hypothetical protein